MSELEDMDADYTRGEDDDETGAASAAPLVSGLGPGVYEDLPIADYVADPCIEPSLRSSDLRRILRLAPRHVQAEHPRLSDRPQWAIRKATKRMDAGSIVHALVLGKGSAFTVIDPVSFTTKDGKPAKGETAEYRAAVAKARARGLIDLKPKTNDAVQRTANALRESLREHLGGDVEELCKIEHTLIWQEETDYGPVLCRTRPDLMRICATALCGEIKGTEVALDDDGVERLLSANDGAYFMQAAWQIRGMTACYPELRGRIEHVFFFGELGYPNLVAPVPTSKVALMQADDRCVRAVQRFAMLRDSGEWKSWPPRVGGMASWLEKSWMADAEKEEIDATPEA